MEISNNMNDELFEKIKICVGYDLIKLRSLSMYDDMSVTQKIKFKKQTTRLYEACMISAEAENYINERYDDIIKKRRSR